MNEPVARLLSIPASHPYTCRVWPADVALRRDPSRPWWPHPALEPDGLRIAEPEVDAVHLHFGYEHRTVAEMAAWCRLLDRLALPLIVTVHDIDHPQLDDSGHHVAQLDVVVPAAAAVVTLTEGAAAWIARRYGRPVSVIEHPPLVPCPPRRRRRHGLGVDLVARRAGHLDPEQVVRSVGSAARTAQTTVTCRVRPEDGDPLTALVARTGLEPWVEMEPARGPSSDEAFATRHASFEAVVLPYRHGTHSGRLELCRDVGTTVLATSCGYLTEQWAAVVTVPVEAMAVAGDDRLVAAIRSATLGPRPPVPSAASQRRRLRRVQEAHRRLLARVLNGALRSRSR